MRVGESVDKEGLIKQIVLEKGGIAKTSDFVEAGIPAGDVASLSNQGFLSRIKHGYYELTGEESALEEQIIAKLIPQAVVCVESALFHYGYSDFVPRKWSIAVPRSMSRNKLEIKSLLLQTYYVLPEFYELGKTTGDFNGTTLQVYDKERTICDCFRFRARLDNETFNKAVNAYARDPNKNLANLSIYSKRLRVHRKVMELMEVLLNS